MTVEIGQAEVNVFVRTPQGFEGHIKVVTEASKAVNVMRILSEGLTEQNFEPSTRSALNGSGPRPAKAAAEPENDNPGCPDCGGVTEFKQGKAKNGRPWAGYFCLKTKDMPQNKRHTPHWVED